MAKRAHAYPQVDPGAAALVDAPVASVPRGARVGEALRLARRRQAVAVSADGRAWILRDDLARAARLGLDELPAAMLARPVPAVESRVSEIVVRRHLASGAPVVIVRDGRRGALGAIGAVAATTFTSSSPRFPERLSAFARDALTALGPPPWDTIRKWPQFREIVMAYQAKRVTAAPLELKRTPPYDSYEERQQYAEGDDFSFLHFIGETMAGPETKIDLPALGTTSRSRSTSFRGSRI